MFSYLVLSHFSVCERQVNLLNSKLINSLNRRATVIVTGRNLQAARDTEINIRNRTFLGKVVRC